MDNQQVSRRTSLVNFFNRRRLKPGLTATESFISEEESDSAETFENESDLYPPHSAAFSAQPSNYTHKETDKNYQRHLNKFSKRVSMTPVENSRTLPRTGSSVSLATKFKQFTAPNPKKGRQYQHPARKIIDSSKVSYERTLEKWSGIKRLNESTAYNDPMIHAEERLQTFLDYYDAYLRDEPFAPNVCSEDITAFWSISTLKYLTGVNVVVTDDILTEFENFDLKHTDKMRILKLDDSYFGIEWAWQLAIDNPGSEVYDFSTNSIVYNPPTADGQSRSNLVGPNNFHIVHGDSFVDLPFSKNSFSFELAYNLFLEIRDDEWVPTLTELHRVLQSQGTLNLFLMDYTTVNCTNEKYGKFYQRVREILVKRNIDPMPCRKIISRMKEAGFEEVKYSFISLEKGVANKVGMMMDFVYEYFEFVLFTKISKLDLDEEEIKVFKELKLQYHEDLRNGKLLEEFGDAYFMFVFGRKQ